MAKIRQDYPISNRAEIRAPKRLISSALADKQIKLLRFFIAAKLDGHRSEIKALCQRLKIHPKTALRLIKNITAKGWAGTDGTFIYPRSWRKLKLSKRGGLYLTTTPNNLKKFEALCFAMALKQLYRKTGGPQPNKGRLEQEDFPTGFLAEFLGIKERRFKSLKASAQRYRYISVTPQVTIIGAAKDFHCLKKNIHGPPVFIRGKHTVVPDISKLKVLI